MERERPLRIGVFGSIPRAEEAVAALLQAGFPSETLSVVCSQDCERGSLADVRQIDPAGEKTAEAAVTGGAAGAVLGGLVAAGIAASGGTALLAVGPLLGTAGGVAGGFVGAMSTRGIEPEIADFYDQALRKGQVLVAVEPPEGGPGPRTAESVFDAAGVEPMVLGHGG